MAVHGRKYVYPKQVISDFLFSYRNRLYFKRFHCLRAGLAFTIMILPVVVMMSSEGPVSVNSLCCCHFPLHSWKKHALGCNESIFACPHVCFFEPSYEIWPESAWEGSRKCGRLCFSHQFIYDFLRWPW